MRAATGRVTRSPSQQFRESLTRCLRPRYTRPVGTKEITEQVAERLSKNPQL
jgi:hypothetical protein